MADRKYYCICDAGCKFETLNKEQIYTAITQAVETGAISDVDAGFVQTIKTINGQPLKFFVGKQSEYERLSEDSKQNLFAIITNDGYKEALFAAVEDMRKDIVSLTDGSMAISMSQNARTIKPVNVKSHTCELTALNMEIYLDLENGKTYLLEVEIDNTCSTLILSKRNAGMSTSTQGVYFGTYATPTEFFVTTGSVGSVLMIYEKDTSGNWKAKISGNVTIRYYEISSVQ